MLAARRAVDRRQRQALQATQLQPLWHQLGAHPVAGMEREKVSQVVQVEVVVGAGRAVVMPAEMPVATPHQKETTAL